MPVISVEALSKSYRLGQIGTGTIANDLNVWWAKLRGKPNPLLRIGQADYRDRLGEALWALREITFSVEQGEVLGIIGRNGAGKSTLLKILSRVTAPTSGKIKVKGRVSSLLEVGTGFHPELTGRENVFLNGAILGMGHAEIKSKFDEILDFAGIEKFVDTPVKRYSSGMYVRLAFAVAAHLDPEILVVDEVLAVGDAGFQKKCLGKMSDVAQGGRTILFVSHNMQAIRSLCSRSILLEEGKMICDAPTTDTLQTYNRRLSEMRVDMDTSIHDPQFRRGTGHVRISSISVMDTQGHERYEFEMSETVRFCWDYRVFEPMSKLSASVALRSGITGELITSVRHVISSEPVPVGTTGQVIIEFPNIFLRPGEYPLYFSMDDMVKKFDVVDNLTLPLVVTLSKKNQDDPNFSTKTPPGYFSVPSTLILGSMENIDDKP
ncbi:MAG TPA: ABC transporter ATP-binding protein [Anaerolineales bacterium]|nr:ABC transporter ATP-binding protein [Anaerolineales bacterium]